MTFGFAKISNLFTRRSSQVDPSAQKNQMPVDAMSPKGGLENMPSKPQDPHQQKMAELRTYQEAIKEHGAYGKKLKTIASKLGGSTTTFNKSGGASTSNNVVLENKQNSTLQLQRSQFTQRQQSAFAQMSKLMATPSEDERQKTLVSMGTSCSTSKKACKDELARIDHETGLVNQCDKLGLFSTADVDKKREWLAAQRHFVKIKQDQAASSAVQPSAHQGSNSGVIKSRMQVKLQSKGLNGPSAPLVRTRERDIEYLTRITMKNAQTEYRQAYQIELEALSKQGATKEEIARLQAQIIPNINKWVLSSGVRDNIKQKIRELDPKVVERAAAAHLQNSNHPPTKQPIVRSIQGDIDYLARVHVADRVDQANRTFGEQWLKAKQDGASPSTLAQMQLIHQWSLHTGLLSPTQLAKTKLEIEKLPEKDRTDQASAQLKVPVNAVKLPWTAVPEHSTFMADIAQLARKNIASKREAAIHDVQQKLTEAGKKNATPEQLNEILKSHDSELAYLQSAAALYDEQLDIAHFDPSDIHNAANAAQRPVAPAPQQKSVPRAPPARKHEDNADLPTNRRMRDILAETLQREVKILQDAKDNDATPEELEKMMSTFQKRRDDWWQDPKSRVEVAQQLKYEQALKSGKRPNDPFTQWPSDTGAVD